MEGKIPSVGVCFLKFCFFYCPVTVYCPLLGISSRTMTAVHQVGLLEGTLDGHLTLHQVRQDHQAVPCTRCA